MSHYSIGGTNVDFIEGGTNVVRSNVIGTYFGGKKVAASLEFLLPYSMYNSCVHIEVNKIFPMF